VDVLGQLQTSYDSMCNLISNILHNLVDYQQDDVKDEIPNGTPKTLIPYDGVLNKDGVSKLGSKPKGDHVAHF
jgi:hypothetical protein